MIRLHRLTLAALSSALAFTTISRGDEPASPPAAKPDAQKTLAAEEAIKRLKLPGVKINLKERCIDVDSTISLEEGMLELIACTKDTKEHESIIVIDALPKHVHTALLLIGAKSGNPAMRKPIDDEGTRWIDVPPRGGAIGVFLVFENKDGKVVERPISDFIVPVDDGFDDGFDVGGGEGDKVTKFPTHNFLFAGSILHGEGPGPKKYLSDLSGNVISISTFGDELLCLPGIHGHANGELSWQVESKDLPEIGTKVTLRLRPQTKSK